MKRGLRSFLAFTVLLFFVLLSACRSEDVADDILPGDDDNDNDLPEVQPTTVYFYNSLDWETVNVYAWDSAGEIFGEWPGAAASQEGTSNWWSAEVPRDVDINEFEIIFNNGLGAQTDDIKIENRNDVYLTVNGTLFSSKESAEASLVSEFTDTRIYFYNSEDWQDIHAYIFGSAGELFGVWPGEEAVQEGTSDWWFVDVPVDTATVSITIIFNGLDVQTDDIVINNRESVYITAVSEVFTSKALAEDFMSSYVPTTTVWFYNSEGWSTVYGFIASDTELLGAFPGTLATQDGDTDWWSVEVLVDPTDDPFTITFNDGDQETSLASQINTSESVYVTMAENQVFTNRAAAEAWYLAESTTEVFFYNSGDWSTVNAYVWDEDDNQVLGGWPGTAATQIDDTAWWVIEIPLNLDNDAINIIFNGDGKQTADITLSNSTDVYITVYNGVFDSKTAAEDSVSTIEGVTEVFFYNSGGWENVYAYTFEDGGNLLGDWPGTAATQIDDTEWYKIELPVNLDEVSVKIIFNNNDGSQTGDLTLSNSTDVYITVYSEVFDSKTAAEDSVALIESETTVYFYNSGEWENVYAYVFGDGGEVFGSWPGEVALEVVDKDNWFYVVVPLNVNVIEFEIIFTNNDGEQAENALINDEDLVYVTIDAVYSSISIAEAWTNVDPENTTEVYFYNSGEWDAIYAYTFGERGDVLDGWPGTLATQVDDTDWWVIEVPVDLALDTFTIIFNNNDGMQTVNLPIDDEDLVYATLTGLFASKEAAEASLVSTFIWFYNNQDLENLHAYVFGDAGELLGGWPGTSAQQDDDPNWYYVEVGVDPDVTPFTIIFNWTGGQTDNIEIDDSVLVHLTINNEKFDSKEAAEDSLID